MGEPDSSSPIHDLRPATPRWTHIALRVADIDASIAWYDTFTPLELLDRRQDELGFGAWLGQPDSADRPFILVLAQFLPATDPFGAYPKEVLAPFAHIGIELPTHGDIEAIAARAADAGCPSSSGACLASGTTSPRSSATVTRSPWRTR